MSGERQQGLCGSTASQEFTVWQDLQLPARPSVLTGTRREEKKQWDRAAGQHLQLLGSFQSRAEAPGTSEGGSTVCNSALPLLVTQEI